MTTIALVGPDGAGKTTVARAVVARLPVASAYRYMGVNLETDRSLLPTTRLVVALKRRRGDRPDLTARFEPAAAGTPLPGRLGRGLVNVARLAVWVSEEWHHVLRVWADQRRGALVITDRDFLCDAWASDVAGAPGRPLTARAHGWLLRHLYPRPDRIVVLDVPAAMLQARRAGVDGAVIERRREGYLGLVDALPGVVVVDASRPLGDVVEVIVRLAVGLTDGDPTGRQPFPGPIHQEVDP